MRFTECQKYMHNNLLMKNHVGKGFYGLVEVDFA